LLRTDIGDAQEKLSTLISAWSVLQSPECVERRYQECGTADPILTRVATLPGTINGDEAAA